MLPVQRITATGIAIWTNGNSAPDRFDREKGATWVIDDVGILVQAHDRVYFFPWFSISKVGFDV